jgi:hypothetical protein
MSENILDRGRLHESSAMLQRRIVEPCYIASEYRWAHIQYAPGLAQQISTYCRRATYCAKTAQTHRRSAAPVEEGTRCPPTPLPTRTIGTAPWSRGALQRNNLASGAGGVRIRLGTNSVGKRRIRNIMPRPMYVFGPPTRATSHQFSPRI